MYGEMSHCPTLNATTKTPKTSMFTTPIRLRISANTSVDKPIIRANVPIMDKRSFHTLGISITSQCSQKGTCLYPLLLEFRL